MAQSEDIYLYLQTLPSYQLSDSEVSELLGLAREGDASAFLELVRANMKPIVMANLASMGDKIPPLEMVVATALGITRVLPNLLNYNQISGDTLRRALKRGVEYVLRFGNRTTRRNPDREPFMSSVARVVANFFQANDRMPSPDEVVEQLKTLNGYEHLDEERCEKAKSYYARFGNLHESESQSERIANTTCGCYLGYYDEFEALKTSLCEQCLTAIADEIGNALGLPAERVSKIRVKILTRFYRIGHYRLLNFIFFN